MKNKGLIFGALTSLFSLLIIIPLCIGNWASYVGDKVSEDQIGMFADWSNTAKVYEAADKTFPTFWNVLIAIMAIAALVAGVAYLILYVLDLAKVTKPDKTNGIKKVLAWIMIACGLIALISGIIFMSASKLSVTVLTVTSTSGYTGTIGFYLAWIFPLLAGICGLLGSCTGKKSSKKR